MWHAYKGKFTEVILGVIFVTIPLRFLIALGLWQKMVHVNQLRFQCDLVMIWVSYCPSFQVCWENTILVYVQDECTYSETNCVFVLSKLHTNSSDIMLKLHWDCSWLQHKCSKKTQWKLQTLWNWEQQKSCVNGP